MKTTNTIYWQHPLILAPQPRGFHLIITDILNALATMPSIQTGIAHFFLQHTSASLTICENSCDDVKTDLEHFFNHLVLEDNSLYKHTIEGSDDMPAHIKNVLIGASLNVPIHNNQLLLGTWQGIFLCEHRNHAPARTIIITVHGQ